MEFTLPLEGRLRDRYQQLVKAHMKSSQSTAAGPAVLPETASAQAATQAAWRFLHNEAVTLDALVQPLRAAGREQCAASDSDYVLLAHDWSKLDYGRHRSKTDVRQLTHQSDWGYDLTTALLIDAADGAPLAPMQMHVKTADSVHSTASTPPEPDDSHLEQLRPTMDELPEWDLPRPVVHIIDREADSVDHLRDWHEAGHDFLVRGDDRRVLWDGQSRLISEIVAHHDGQCLYEDVREVEYHGRPARQEVAETEIVLHRPARKSIDGRKVNVPGPPLPLRLVMARVVDEEGSILAEWDLLTNVSGTVIAATIALWYYWRWRIETFFKLLKSHGQQIEHWQQRDGLAITRRLLVASMACVVVWILERTDTPEAEQTRKLLIRLSGRRMKRGRTSTAPVADAPWRALLDGYFVLLSITDLLEHTDFDPQKLKILAAQALPFMDTG